MFTLYARFFAIRRAAPVEHYTISLRLIQTNKDRGGVD